VLVEQVPPRFPTRAHRMGITEGVVSIAYTVDEQGNVVDPQVVSADPPRVFDEAALDAIRKWRYRPKLVNGATAASRQRFTFRFQ
jgi:periplasmic protein TonB